MLWHSSLQNLHWSINAYLIGAHAQAYTQTTLGQGCQVVYNNLVHNLVIQSFSAQPFRVFPLQCQDKYFMKKINFALHSSKLDLSNRTWWCLPGHYRQEYSLVRSTFPPSSQVAANLNKEISESIIFRCITCSAPYESSGTGYSDHSDGKKLGVSAS